MSLVQKIQDGNLDIIGDIHGEYEALLKLLKTLGYDEEGNHPKGRKLVFVGDFCDRGPNSPAVIFLIKKLIENGNAQAVLGNHEINLLQNKAKDGAGWYFKRREAKDHEYLPFAVTTDEQRQPIYDFLASLPIALERDDIRVVHAVWDNERIEIIKQVGLGTISQYYLDWEQKINNIIDETGLLPNYKQEQETWKDQIIDPNAIDTPFLPYTAEYSLVHQMTNPVRVLTAGTEETTQKPFFASGKWRFVKRGSWWDSYTDEVPVVVGHFWRRLIKPAVPKNFGGDNLFQNIEITAWHGKLNNVFCVDYSVGGRFKERNEEGVEPGFNTMLVAMNWPERTLTFENGKVVNTEDFNKGLNNLKANKPK